MKAVSDQQDDESKGLINHEITSYNNNDDEHRQQSSRLEWAESSWTRYLHVFCWWWIDPLLSIGYKRSLTENDLDDLPNDDKSFALLNRLRSYDWSEKSTWKIIIEEFGKEYLFASILLIPYSIVHIAQPLLIHQILFNIINKPQSYLETFVYAFLLMICSLCVGFFGRQNIFRSIRVGVRIRNALIGLIFMRSLSAKLTIWQQINTGQIINLVASDTRKLEEVFTYLHYLWLGPTDIVVTFALLFWFMKPIPTLLGFIVVILFLLAQLLTSRKYEQYRRITATCCDKRVHGFSEFIHGFYNIKTQNWEKLVEDQIRQLRHDESISIQRASHLRTFVISLPILSTSIIAFTIFGSSWLLGHPLDVVNTFTVLSFLHKVRTTAINYMTTAIDKLNEARIASKRIDLFMQLITAQQQQEQHFLSHVSSADQQQKGTIVMSNASFTWCDDIPCLSSLNLTIEPWTLVGIVGSVGSGKSSLLSAILGEMNLIHGHLNTNDSSFSYAAQSSWILADTLRNNILLNQTFHEQRYRDVIYACCLDVDIAVFGSSGDRTMVGEKGVNLSGGQKARVSLARALYADADIYLMDDPLAAVDHNVAKQIYERCIGPNGFLKEKTRLLVSHQTQFLKEAHQVIFLSHGHIEEEGQLDESIIKEDEIKKEEFSELVSILDDKTSVLDIQSIINRETAVSGHVHWSVWYRLFTAPPSGKVGFCLLIISFLLGTIFYDGTNYWLSRQLRSSDLDRQHSPNFGFIYLGLTLIIVLLNIFRYDYFFRVFLYGSDHLHNKMLKGLLYTSIQFFESNPSGRILNRVSNDQQVIDDILPGTLIDGLIALLTLVSSIIVICLVDPRLLLMFVVVVAVFIWLSLYYLQSTCQLKRIESITRSPIYDLFSSSLNGLASIRAFKVKDDFIRTLTQRIDVNTSAHLSMKAASQWLSLRLQCIAAVIVLIVVIFSMLFQSRIDPPLIALRFMYAVSLSFWLQWAIMQLIEAYIMMTSAERIEEFAQLPLEEDHGGHQRLIMTSPKWPDHGTVEFRNYSLCYRSGLNPTLKNINLRIECGQKIGIIGRTGAGKSSLFKGILRFIGRSNVDGQILIDDIDISRITLHHLRLHLNIINQQPILFSGTLRYNLDPFNHYSDEQCWMALEDVQLKEFVRNHPSGLLMSIFESGDNLSMGQCQLICIARAILKKSKILLIDEATANVDEKTDQLIQQVIAEKFHDQTVLAIAHRLNTVARYDRILVLDKGVVVNFDTPANILQQYN